MGLLDGLAGQVMGQVLGSQQGGNAVLGMVTQLLQDNGGLGGLLQKFEQSGMADHVASWVGRGANMPVDASQVVAALGSGALGNLAAKFGIPADQVADALATALPQAVDHLTPTGQVTADSGSLDSLAGMLGGLLKS
jgi:uncharacterized protein YidB (DUF937 family)